MKNHRKTCVFQWFFEVSHSIGKLRSNMVSSCIRGPKSVSGPQLGGQDPPKEPNLEAWIAPKTPTGRPKALYRPQLGGLKPFQDANLEAPSGPRLQPGGLKELNLEPQSPSDPPTCRPEQSKDAILEDQSPWRSPTWTAKASITFTSSARGFEEVLQSLDKSLKNLSVQHLLKNIALKYFT